MILFLKKDEALKCLRSKKGEKITNTLKLVVFLLPKVLQFKLDFPIGAVAQIPNF